MSTKKVEVKKTVKVLVCDFCQSESSNTRESWIYQCYGCRRDICGRSSCGREELWSDPFDVMPLDNPIFICGNCSSLLAPFEKAAKEASEEFDKKTEGLKASWLSLVEKAE